MRTSPSFLRLLAPLALGLLLVAGCKVKDASFTEGTGSADAAAVDDAPPDVPTGPPGFLIDMTSTLVTEGTSRPFTVALTAPPADFMLVTVTSADDGKLGVVPTALVFSTSNWSTPKSVMLTGKADLDTANETVNLTLSADGIDTPYAVDITVADDDGVNVALNATSLNVGEGTTATLGVSLTAQPAADVTLSVVSGAATAATVSQPSMTFTPQNWNSVQTLTINGVQDANTTDGSTMLTFSSPDAPTVMLPMTVTGDDVLALALSSTTLSLGEGGTTTFTVALTQDPGASKAVTLTTASAAIGTATPTTMTFTGRASGNWGAPQLVSVSAPADDDTANASTSITLAATGLSDRVVSIAVTDDDVQAITPTPNPPMTVAVTEGATGTLAVRLAFKPAADVTIPASSLAPGVATVTPATLTFSTTDWAMPQNATVTALQDADAAAGSTTIRLEAAALGLTRDVGVTVTDDDTLALALSSTTATVTEGLTTTFTVALTAQPLASTTISIATSNAATATATSTVTFSTTDWATPKTVTVTGVQDTNLAADTATLTLSASGGATITPATVTVAATDDDTQAIVASSATVGVTEGSTAQFTVRLAFQPAANVTVNVASGNTAIATVNAATLSFTTATWNTPQTVTVTAPQDADTMGNTTMVALTSSALTTNVTINVTDDDALNIALSPSTFNVYEGGTATLNVSLTAQLAANLTVTLASGDATAVTLGTTSLTFTTTNWATAQPVTVTGVEDADAAQEAVTITATAGALTRTATATTIENASDNPQIASVTTTSVSFTSSDWSGYQFVPGRGGFDPDYDVETTTVRFTTPGVPQNAVTVTVAEQDVMYSSGPNPSTICEGDAMYMEIALNGAPGGPLAVNVDPPYFMFASTQQVLFDSTNWTTPQGVWLDTSDTSNGVVYLSTDDSLSYLPFNVTVTRNVGGFECLARR